MQPPDSAGKGPDEDVPLTDVGGALRGRPTPLLGRQGPAEPLPHGGVLAPRKKNTGPEKGVNSVIGRIEETVRRVFKRMGATASDFEGLCIGAHAAVDLVTGIVRAFPNLDWRDIPLGEALRERLGLPVFVHNDVNLNLLSEHVYGAGRGTLHVLVSMSAPASAAAWWSG